MNKDITEIISQKFHKFDHIDYCPSQISVFKNLGALYDKICENFLCPDDEIIIISPYREFFIDAVKNHNVIPIIIKSEKLTKINCIKKISDKITKKTKAIYLCLTYNYNNLIYSNNILNLIAETAIKHELLIISDELYLSQYIRKKNYCSIVTISKDIKDNVVLISGLTKDFLDVGIRYCYYACSSIIINRYNVIRHICDNDNYSYNIPFSITPENINIDIVYEDKDIIIVNKPRGMLVHINAKQQTNTLTNALVYHYKNNLSTIRGVLLPGIVHRIDKDTSGLLVFCKNNKSQIKLAKQFKIHSIYREYYAIVYGQIYSDGIIKKNISYDYEKKKNICVKSGGKWAVTHYYVIKTYKNASFIKCVLETGRQHQIRVHLASIGHPIIGDNIYGNEEQNNKLNISEQILHAKILAFKHPGTNEYINFDSELPDYFKSILNKLA